MSVIQSPKLHEDWLYIVQVDCMQKAVKRLKEFKYDLRSSFGLDPLKWHHAFEDCYFYKIWLRLINHVPMINQHASYVMQQKHDLVSNE